MRGLPLGKPFGIPFELHWSWLAIFALLTWSLAASLFPGVLPGLTEAAYFALGAVTALLFFASVLAHELGHALTARRLGVQTERIVLFFFGGVAQLSASLRSGRDEVLVAAAGPLVSVALALGFWALTLVGSAPWGGEIAAVALWLARINALLALFNLLPAFPLDGGRILRGLVWQRTKSLQSAMAVALGVGGVVSWAMIGFGVFEVLRGDIFGGVWLVLLAFMLQGAAAAEAGQTLVHGALSHLPPARDLAQRDWPTVARDTRLSQVAALVQTGGRGLFPVVEDGRWYGAVTLSDLQRFEPSRWPWWTVDAVMRPRAALPTLDGSASAAQALEVMAKARVPFVVVEEEGVYLGVLSQDQLMTLVQLHGARQERRPAERGEAGAGRPQGGLS